jgi:microsomal epoxide hydrolase
MAASPEPFVLAVPEALLNDLQQRLALTRWPDEIPGSGWHYGVHLAYVKELVRYWQQQYDWRAQERLLNSFPQYRVQMEDITLYTTSISLGWDLLPCPCS